MGKKNKSKAGGDFWDEDEDLQEQQSASVEFGDSAGGFEVAEEPDDFNDDNADADAGSGGGLLGAIQRSKNKKAAKAAEDAEAAAAAKQGAAVQVKSKKEKEREKKEREKAKKKAQAARKAAGKATQEYRENASREASKEPAAASSASDSTAAEEASKKPEKPAAGKKKLNPALAAIQKQQAARKAAEEAKLAQQEEARHRAEEEERLALEEEAAIEAARLAKKEKERKKKEELKAQGKFFTKKQKEQQAALARRREALLASGVQIPAVTGDKPVKKTPKPKPKATVKEEKEEAKEIAPAPVVTKKPVKEPVDDIVVDNPVAAEEEAASDAIVDDWEAAFSDEDTKIDDTEASVTPEGSTSAQTPASESSDHAHHHHHDSREATKEEQWKVLDAKRRAEVDAKREARRSKAEAAASARNLRSPICAILGHVDTGKTKLLDNMRKTNVQEGEAGGITQQIGATYFPIEMIEKKCEVMKSHVNVQFNVPGLLIIDTPGHESFSNLRSRGSSLCNIAILVVDILHGLEPQTLESIRLLRDRKTPFVVALNKIDRLYGWKATPNNSFRDSLKAQSDSVKSQFEDRLEKTKVLFAEQGFNAEVYDKNRNISKYVSLVPTSAVTGEGVPDLLYLLLELTQTRMSKQLMYLSELEATILEVKVIEGLGTTIDVVLSNGVLREGDRIVLCGMNGAICTNVRALLTPQPARELRIKGQYVHHKEVKAALGVKIAANDLEQAVAGSRLLVVGPDDDEEEMMDDVMEDMTGLLDMVDKTGEGVCVQASTLGSLEALLDFLKDMKIPVMSIGLGPVFKRDVMRASPMLEKNKTFAVMLCFDVRIDKEAEHYATEQGIKLFTADIIYHLFDEFTAYQKQMLEQRRQETRHEAVFPAVLNIVQVINKRNPMIVGVDIAEGSLRIGTPIAIVKMDPATKQKLVYPLGRIQSMEVDHKSRDNIRKGQANAGVAMRLDSGNMTNMPTWGRHIDEKDTLYSLISRKSIDVLKDQAFRDDVSREDWLLIKKLKPVFDIK